MQQLPRETYLGIGTLIKKYNQKNPGQREDLKPLYDKLTGILNGCKKGGGKLIHRQEDKIVSVLKGIRNSNVLLPSLLERLQTCSSELQASRIRVAAIQALGADACDKAAQTIALGLLKSKHEDSEIRIEAYLIVAQCPNALIANELNAILESEESVQVGSFITTHLANLRSSVDASREQARKELANVRSSKKYPWDLRGTSLNSEISYAVDSLGLSAVADTNIIYSQQSFVPRSLRTNLTGSVFGTTFNFVEVGLRQENLDLVLEKYFGPKGLWKTTNKADLVSSLVKRLHGGDGKGKHKRDLTGDVRNFEKGTHWHASPVNDDRELDLDLSVKIFGSDLVFLSLNNTLPTDARGFEKLIKQSWESFLKHTKNGWKINVQRNSLLLDANLLYPTALGVPLKLQVQGSAALRLQAELQADLHAIVKNPKQTAFKIRVEPSWNLDLTGSLTADAFLVATGLQVVGNIHSAVGTTLNVNLANEGRKLTIVNDFSQAKQEILSVDHKVQFITQEIGRQTVANRVKSKTPKSPVVDHCFDQLSGITGAELCLKYTGNLFAGREGNVVNTPVFPLNGPNTVSVWLLVEQKYKIEADYDDSTGSRRLLSVTADTPGSKVSRKSTLTLEGQIEPKVLARAILLSPIRNCSAEAGLERSDSELALYGKVDTGAERMSSKIGFKKVGGGARIEYTPVIEVDLGQGQENIGYRASGKLIVDKSKSPKLRYEFQNLHLETPPDATVGPLTLNGHLEHEGSKEIDANLNLKHRAQTVDVALKLKSDAKGVNLDLGIGNNVNELLNGRIILKNVIEKTDTRLQADRALTLIYGKDRESQSKRIEIFHTIDAEVDAESRLTKLATKNKLNLGFLPLVGTLDLSGDAKQAQYLLSLETSKGKIGSDFKGSFSTKKPGDWNINLGVQAKQQEVRLTSTREILGSGDKSEVKTALTSTNGASADLTAKYDHVFNKRHANLNVDGNLKLASDQPPLKLVFALVVAPKNVKVNGKITDGANEVVTITSNADRNIDDGEAPLKGTGHIKIDDLVIADWNYASTKGVGSADLIVGLPKLDRKVKLGSTFEHTSQKCDVLVELLYNFEKNPKDRIAAETKNVFQGKSITSDNEIDVNGEKIQLNWSIKRVGDERKGSWKGESRLRLPTNREIALSINKDIDLTAPKGSGNAKIKLTDTVKTGGAKVRSIELDGKFTDAVPKERLIHAIHKLTLTSFDGKTIIVDTDIKHLPQGKFKSAGAAITVSGTGIPNSLSLVASVDEYCPIHAVFQVSAKHGTDAQLSLNGKYEVGARGGKPSTYMLRGSLQAPQTTLKRLAFDTTGSCKLAAADDKQGLNEYSITLNGDLNGKALAISSSGKGNQQSLDSSLNVKLPEVDELTVSVKSGQNGLWLDENTEAPRVANGDVVINYGNGKLIHLKGDVTYVNKKSLDIKAEVQTPYEQAKSVVLVVKQNVSSERKLRLLREEITYILFVCRRSKRMSTRAQWRSRSTARNTN